MDPRSGTSPRAGMIYAGYEDYDTDHLYDNLTPVSLTVWGQDYRSEEEAVVDMSLLPMAKEGDVAELVANVEGERRNLYFVLKAKPASSNAQLSVNQNLLTSLGIRSRSTVQVQVKSKIYAQIDVLELHFKGIELTRADEYRIGKSLSDKCVYVGQRVHYLGGTVRLIVKNIYRNGKLKFSGHVGPHTRVVIRSDSSRMLIFIQISAEMWQFESTGDVVFDRLVNSFIPELLQRWRNHGDHHLVSIVLFTTVSTNKKAGTLAPGELDPYATDYYRVVIDKMHVSRWADIMSTLRYEFARFDKDVLTNEHGELRGRILPSSKGNVVQAWSLATTLLGMGISDHDISRANHQVMVITPGTALFDVDRAEFYQISKLILSALIGVELICLSKPPLHITPMFRALNPDGTLTHYVPTWVNVSFSNTQNRFQKQWTPRCKIYDIQMMGVIENEIKSVSIRHMAPGPYSWRFMKTFDTNIFKSVEMITSQRKIEEAAQSSASATLLRPIDFGSSQSQAISESVTASATASKPRGDDSPKSNARSRLGALLKGSQRRTLKQKTSESSLASVAKSPIQEPNQTREVPVESETTKMVFPSKPKPMPIPNHHIRRASTHRAAHRLTPTSGPNLSPVSPNRRISDTHANGFSKALQQLSLDEFHWHMWRVLPNPSVVDTPTRLKAYGRWANVYPPGFKRSVVSWRSIKSPASLPITTEVFPSPHEFQHDFKFQFYDLTVGLQHEKWNAGHMLEELICLRLQQGFQIVVGDRVIKIEKNLFQGDSALVCQAISKEDYVGSRVYMIRGSLIHRLSIDQDGVINVQLYTWVDPDHDLANAVPSRSASLRVKTVYDTTYHDVHESFSTSMKPKETNWSRLDQQITGNEDTVSDGGQDLLTLTRFLVLPAEKGNKVDNTLPEQLNEDEIKVEAVRKVVFTLLKNRYYAGPKPKAAIDNMVHFYTGNIGDSIQAMYEESHKSATSRALFHKDRLHKGMKLMDIATEMQGERGLFFTDRSWNRQVYRRAFAGQSMVAWMIDAFSDIDSVEEATSFGNHLMEKKVFLHVDNRHQFMDGHYFYQLAPEYVVDQPLDGQSTTLSRWFGGGGSESENDRKKRRVAISRAVPINVDPKKMSDRLELVNVHLDRVHNPKNAYGIRVEWLHATPRLVEEMFTGLARVANGFGCKLVQVPVDEISLEHQHSPFRSALKLNFQLDPREVPLQSHLSRDPLESDPLYYQHYLLRNMGFVLDMPSKTQLQSSGFQIEFSWGSGEFENAQYIHTSGNILAQVFDDGSFYMLPNTIHLARYNIYKANSAPYSQQRKVMDDIKVICTSPEVLQDLFTEAQEAYNCQTPENV